MKIVIKSYDTSGTVTLYFQDKQFSSRYGISDFRNNKMVFAGLCATLAYRIETAVNECISKIRCERYMRFDIMQAANYNPNLEDNTMTSEVVKEALEVAKQIDHNAPGVAIAEAAINTAANPGPESILADIELAMSLVTKFKAAMSGVHPSIMSLIKVLL